MDNLTPEQVKQLAILVHAQFSHYNFLFEIVFSTLTQSMPDAEFEALCRTLRERVRYNVTGVPSTMPDDVALAIQDSAIASLDHFLARLRQTRQTQTSPPSQG
jgi:hypothetical protein